MAESKTTKPKETKDSSKDTAAEGKIKALGLALESIEKQFGKGSIMKLGDSYTSAAVETTPTGALSLDIALGGGIPRGRVIEIYGSRIIWQDHSNATCYCSSAEVRRHCGLYRR